MAPGLDVLMCTEPSLHLAADAHCRTLAKRYWDSAGFDCQLAFAHGDVEVLAMRASLLNVPLIQADGLRHLHQLLARVRDHVRHLVDAALRGLVLAERVEIHIVDIYR